jgi:predicted GIY-YIG superfamily endonuclease
MMSETTENAIITPIKKRVNNPKKKEGEEREVIIYKIEIDGTDFLYVGSTQDFEQRKKNHSAACIHNLNPNSKSRNAKLKLYNEINKCGGWNKAIMTPIEKIIVSKKIDALIREQYWIDKIQVARSDSIMLNGHRAHVSDEILAQNIKNQSKKYYEQNKEIIKEKAKQYYIENKEKKNKQTLQYYETHKDIIKKRISENNKQRIICTCGIEYSKGNKLSHFNSNRHLKLIKEQDQKYVDKLETELNKLLDNACQTEVNYCI